MNKQAMASKEFLIKMHRRKKDLCETCGRFLNNETHECIENYIKADLRDISNEELYEYISKQEKKLEQDILKEEKDINKIKDQIKSVEQRMLTEDNKEEKISDHKDFEYLIIDNLSEKIDYSYLEFIAKRYKNNPIFLLLIDKDKIRKITSLCKINRLANVFFYDASKSSDKELEKLLNESTYVFCYNNIITSFCKEEKLSFIELPKDKNIDIELIKTNEKYWKVG